MIDPFFIQGGAWAALGMITHLVLKLKDEQAAAGHKMNLEALRQFVTSYLVWNLLTLVALVLVLAGWLFILHQIGDLSVVNAYLSGLAGNSVAIRTSNIAKTYVDQAGPK
jgi:uncharacterized membrane protein